MPDNRSNDPHDAWRDSYGDDDDAPRGQGLPDFANLPDHLRRQADDLRRSVESLGETLRANLDPQAAVEKLRALVGGSVERAFADVADDVQGVGRLGVVFVNVYVLNAGGGRWFLVDTGLPGFAPLIKAACDARFDGRPPEAILLTHAHFDHAGNAEALATEWGVPVYAHKLEMPYLTGQADYPPADPTPGGAICFMSRFFPTRGFDLRGRVELRELPVTPEGIHEIPGLPGWRWLHTPGHAPGHVSLFRDFDKLLIAGDALATMDMDSWGSMVSRKRELARPAVPFTPDWRSAHKSIHKLAAMEPRTICAGPSPPPSPRRGWGWR